MYCPNDAKHFSVSRYVQVVHYANGASIEAIGLVLAFTTCSGDLTTNW